MCKKGDTLIGVQHLRNEFGSLVNYRDELKVFTVVEGGFDDFLDIDGTKIYVSLWVKGGKYWEDSKLVSRVEYEATI